MAVDKSKLFKLDGDWPEDEYQLKGVGKITIQALNRWQACVVTEESSVAAREAKMLMFGIKEPKLTLEEVHKWYKSWPAGPFEDLAEKISIISGMAGTSEESEELDRVAVKEF